MPYDTQEDDPYAEMPVKDYSYTAPVSNKPPKPSKKIWIIAGVVIAVLILGGIGTFFLTHHKSVAPKKSSTVTSVSKTNSFDLSFNPTTAYSSVNFNLNVDYPKNWTINDNTTSLTILSPETKLTNGTGQLTSGKILLSVFNQGQIPTAFGTNLAIAVLSSEKVSYTNPTQSQAAQTYLTFVQYPATTVKGGLDAIYVSGNNGYTQLQSVPNGDIAKVSPLVVFSFLQCIDTACAHSSPLTIASTQWSNSGFSGLIKDIVKSFVFN